MVEQVAWSIDGNRLLAAGHYLSMRDVRNGEQLFGEPFYGTSAFNVAMHPDQERFAICTASGKVATGRTGRSAKPNRFSRFASRAPRAGMVAGWQVFGHLRSAWEDHALATRNALPLALRTGPFKGSGLVRSVFVGWQATRGLQRSGKHFCVEHFAVGRGGSRPDISRYVITSRWVSLHLSVLACALPALTPAAGRRISVDGGDSGFLDSPRHEYSQRPSNAESFSRGVLGSLRFASRYTSRRRARGRVAGASHQASVLDGDSRACGLGRSRGGRWPGGTGA